MKTKNNQNSFKIIFAIATIVVSFFMIIPTNFASAVPSLLEAVRTLEYEKSKAISDIEKSKKASDVRSPKSIEAYNNAITKITADYDSKILKIKESKDYKIQLFKSLPTEQQQANLIDIESNNNKENVFYTVAKDGQLAQIATALKNKEKTKGGGPVVLPVGKKAVKPNGKISPLKQNEPIQKVDLENEIKANLGKSRDIASKINAVKDDQNLKNIKIENDKCRDDHAILESKLKDPSSVEQTQLREVLKQNKDQIDANYKLIEEKQAELVQKQNMTDSEKCLAVDVRDRDEKGILPGKSNDDQKISEKNCVTASFYVGLCDDINLQNRSCLKRCGGFSFLNKGYSEDLSFSEISELVSEKSKNNPPTEEESSLSDNLTKIINEGSSPVVIKNANEIPNYLSKNSECKKLFGCYRAISASRNDLNLKTLEKIASGLNQKAVKCNEIKRISQKLKDEKINERYERIKSFSEQVKTTDKIASFIKNETSEGSCEVGGTPSKQLGRILKMRMNGYEEFIVPIQLANQTNGKGRVLSFIDKDGKKRSMNIYEQDGNFFQEEPTSTYQDPEREYRTEIYKVNVSQMGGDFCEKYNLATAEKKKLNDEAKQQTQPKAAHTEQAK